MQGAMDPLDAVTGDRCPCCGTQMQVVEDRGRYFKLRCPVCGASDTRLKG